MGLLPCAQVAELRKKLGEMGLDTKGLKAVLVKRLTDAVAKQEQEGAADTPTADAPAADDGAAAKEAAAAAAAAAEKEAAEKAAAEKAAAEKAEVRPSTPPDVSLCIP